MTKSSQAYFSRPSLPFRVTPFPDEGLGELLLRAAAENCYDGVDRILSLADAKRLVLGKSREPSEETIRSIAEVLHLEEHQMRYLMHPLIPEHPALVSFFGTPIRRWYLDLRERRVSPRSLRKKSYLRACWALRIFSFDFETKEELLDRCPVCTKTLSFRKVFDVWSCSRCSGFDDEGHIRPTVDLRDFPQARIEVEDNEALNFVTSLVEPKFPPLLGLVKHPDLTALSRGELFDLVIALCRATISGPNESRYSLWRPKLSDDFKKFTPDLFALAGRAVLSWPEGFHALASDARNQVYERDGVFGTLEELGALAKITTDRDIPRTIKNVVKTAIHADIAATASLMKSSRRVGNQHEADLIARMDALHHLKCSGLSMAKLALRPEIDVIAPANGRGPVLFLRAQIEEILKRRNEIISGHAVAMRTGISFLSLKHLAECGHIEREMGAVLELMQGGEYYCRRSIIVLEDKIRERGRSGEPPAGSLCLGTGMNGLYKSTDETWVKVIDGILAGNLNIWHRGSRTARLVNSVRIQDQESLTRLLGKPR